MMIKTVYIILPIVTLVVISIAIIGIAIYNNGAERPEVPIQNQTNVSSPVTAFQALKLAEQDPGVASWKASRNDIRVLEITGNCENGRAYLWTIFYVSDKDGIKVEVEEGNVTFSPSERPDMAYPAQRIPDFMIDSDKACSIAGDMAANANHRISGPTIATLSLMPEGATWDVNCQVDEGSYIVRINATSGEVIEKADVKIV